METRALTITPAAKTSVDPNARAPALPCFQCNRCTAGCPMISAMDITPAQLVHLLRLGKEERVLRSETIWLCLGCETCTTRCPQQVNVSGLIQSARRAALARDIAPGRAEVLRFYESFIETLSVYGRASEVGLLAMLRLKDEDYFRDMSLGMTLLNRGRLALFERPHGGSLVRELRRRIRVREGGS